MPMIDTLTEEQLQAAANAAAQGPHFRQALWPHCNYVGRDVGSERLKTRIHPGDQMLLHSLKHFHEINKPLSQYFNVALQQHHAAQQILRHFFPAPPETLKVLDFACGYGRLLRFLSLSIPPENIWAAEIQEEAVNFVVSEYGVNGLLSETDPAGFNPAQRFDFIWVASLFSHLPEPLFRAWVGKLHSLLSPRGVLCFSVHDECLLPAGSPLPPGGIHFVPHSENADLDTCTYGTTYVGESFVSRAIGESVQQPDHPYFRIPRGLANEQDLYVVPANATTDLSGLSGFRHGPWGWVDGIEVSDAGSLEMHGWIASLDDGPLETVSISVDGQVTRVPTGEARPDVARVLGDERLHGSGWRFKGALAPGRDSVFVQVSGSTARNEKTLLYAGFVAVPERQPSVPPEEPAAEGKGLLGFVRRLLSKQHRH